MKCRLCPVGFWPAILSLTAVWHQITDSHYTPVKNISWAPVEHAGLALKNPPKKTHPKNPKFLIFYENNKNFSLSNRFFMNKQIRNKLSFIYKKSKVFTQLRIFQKEIKLTLYQELIHLLGERG